MRVQEAPFFTRPSWKLKEKGVVALDDAELLSLVLWKGTIEESCVDIAKKVLGTFNFSGLGYSILDLKYCSTSLSTKYT